MDTALTSTPRDETPDDAPATPPYRRPLLVLLAVLALLAARVTDAVHGGALALAAWLLLSPSVLPWYALWLLPFAVLGAGAWTTTFSLSSALAYLVYVGYAPGGAWQVEWSVRLAEYGLPLAVLFGQWRRRARGRP